MKKLLYILLFVPLAMFGQQLQIGDNAFGGIIFYLETEQKSGYVAAFEDVTDGGISGVNDSLGFQWGCYYADYPTNLIQVGFLEIALGDSIGTGYQNTIEISNYCDTELGGPSAAEICLEYQNLGYNDWFLPSDGEIISMYENISHISSLGNVGNFITGYYWTSTNRGDGESHVGHFNNAYEYVHNYKRYNAHRVRPIRYFEVGCMDTIAVNFSSSSTEHDEFSCLYSHEYVEYLSTELDAGAIEFNEAVESLSSLQQALDTWNTTIDLSSGWNMFGYGCPSSTDVAEGLSNHTESIIITKDNSGNVYMPEFGFNGIGDFTPGYGYQIKLIEAIEGFSLCDWYVNDIPEDNIVSLQDSLQLINSLIGCTDSLACNYYINKLYDDGSCEHPEQGYDCDGNEWIYSISFSGLNNQYFESYVNNLNSSNGEFISISFWFNPLVGQNESSVISIGGYQLVFYNNGFGFNHSVGDLYGVDTSVFTDSTWSYITAIFYDAFDNQNAHAFEKLYINGQQQTLNCISPINGGFDCNSNLSPPTPLNIGLYSQNIRVGSPYDGSNYIGEIADLIVFNGELSSQEIHNIYCSNDSDLSSKVAHWNFNQEEGVLTDISGSGNDGIIYGGIIGHQIPELNCNNEVYSYQVGDLAEGGIVFYVDESGEHGLVAAVDDMPILYNWMDAQTASENYSIDNYDDWYLPSIENQQLIYQNINNHSSYLPHSSITEFSYWSSTEDSESHAFGFGYYNGEVGSHNKTLLRIVRPIRSF